MSDSVRITVLKDNRSLRPEVTPGHGLSLLVESGTTRVLFDTGPDDTLLANAAAMGVSLRPLDAIVLSHGHYDHTGGLSAVLGEFGPTRVLAHPGVFDETYSRNDEGETRRIGMPSGRDRYLALGARFEFSELPVEISDCLLTTGHVARVHPLPHSEAHLLRRGQSGVLRDDFRDDLSLVVRLANCSALITGCAHAGLLNILYKTQTIAPPKAPRVVLGGLHLGALGDDQIIAIAEEADSLGVRTLLPCHCTGERATQVLTEQFRGQVVLIGTGSVITIDRQGQVHADVI